MGLFKKKEVLDLTKRGIDSDVPTDGYFKRKGLTASSINSNSLSLNNSDSTTQTTSNQPVQEQSTQSSGGFFSFFGGSENSSSTTSNSNASSFSNSGSSTSSPSTSTVDQADFNRLKTQLEDMNYRFSRVLDRLELLEKKMDRLERKDNPSGY